MNERREKPQAGASKPSATKNQHTDQLLDEALKDTFPASDPPAILQPAPDDPADDGRKP